MKILNTTLCFLAAAFLFTATSCKKEKEVTCTMKSVSTPTTTTFLEYDASGYLTKRTDSASGTYTLYTASGAMLTRQSYTAAGTPSGSPHVYGINSAGLIVQDISMDTSFFTYNSAGQLIKQTTGSGTNVTGWTNFTFNGDNIVAMVQYNGMGSIVNTTGIDYYTDKENKTKLNFLSGFLADARYGKSTKNLIKGVEDSDGTNITTTDITYELDGNGYVTSFNILNQPGNTYSSVVVGYSCN